MFNVLHTRLTNSSITNEMKINIENAFHEIIFNQWYVVNYLINDRMSAHFIQRFFRNWAFKKMKNFYKIFEESLQNFKKLKIFILKN